MTSTPYPTPDHEPTVTDESLAFLSNWTNVKDLNILRSHVLKFWTNNKAKYHTYRCIQELMFLQPRICLHPFYEQFIQKIKSPSSTSRVIELGCCFGTDARFLLSQGVPADRLVVTDLHSGYFDLGKELFTLPSSSNEQSQENKLAQVQATFGDMAASHDEVEGAINVHKLGFESHFDYASCFAIFHVLSAEQTLNFIKRVLRMLKPGGVPFGWSVGSLQPGEWAKTPKGDAPRYLHNADSLKALLLETGFSSAHVDSIAHRNSPIQMEENKCRLVFTATK
eukprot:TRINITY_DN4390_c0_g1_i1.p1 TRINITY_DN4390_c0_g1~~TRINITY_DN4390_c0_g1_i1.p1  ORF type:complete len:281 (-),score=54.69 TRINITY_DN4390_c0_g1_i1:347-1189(-)